MEAFDLNFERLPAGWRGGMLDAPPRLRLAGPEHGWIDLVVGEEGGEFAPVTLSQVYPPLADLWVWSLAVAWGLTPVTVRLDEESNLVYLVAETLPDGRLRIGLVRAHGYMPPGEAAPEASLCWLEPRQDFLRRWGRMWAGFLGDGFDQTHWDNDPEPMRDMPWDTLADVPALEPPPWTREQRIAWFYLVVAYQLRSRGHGCEYTENPGYWTLRELAFARLSIWAAQAAWRQLREDSLPLAEALRLIDDAHDEALNDSQAAAQDEQKRRLSPFHGYLDAAQSTFDHIADIVEGCLPRLPIARGGFIADAQGHRAVILRANGREWLLDWDDGRISREDPFYARHRPICRWPVAHGLEFDPDTLDEIDTRRLRFLELGASPVRVVCPVCGYPAMDDDVDDVQSCDICGYEALWRLTYGEMPALDATVDDEGDPISPTLRERRAFFLAHGDAWSAGHAAGSDDDYGLAHYRHPERQRLTREAIAEWDAWLEHPYPDHTPEEVWRRWNRWQAKQRKNGGPDDA